MVQTQKVVICHQRRRKGMDNGEMIPYMECMEPRALFFLLEMQKHVLI